MNKVILATVLASTLLPALPAAAAGRIEKACLRSERPGSAALCGCIQQVADMTLSRSDQKTAAGFFEDPEEAQEIRASKKASDNEFWARYKNFGTAAEAYCTR